MIFLLIITIALNGKFVNGVLVGTAVAFVLIIVISFSLLVISRYRQNEQFSNNEDIS